MPQDYPIVPQRDPVRVLCNVDVGNMLASSKVETNQPIHLAQGVFWVNPQRYDRHSDRTSMSKAYG